MFSISFMFRLFFNLKYNKCIRFHFHMIMSEVVTPLWAMKLDVACSGIVEKCNVLLCRLYEVIRLRNVGIHEVLQS